MSNHLFVIDGLICVSGLTTLLCSMSYLKRILGLGIFQFSVIFGFLLLGKSTESIPPVKSFTEEVYTSPLCQVLMLTAIVVGFGTLCLGITMVRKISRSFGTINVQEIKDIVKSDASV